MARVRANKYAPPAITHSFEDGTCTRCGEQLSWLLGRRWGRLGGHRTLPPTPGQGEFRFTMALNEGDLRHQRRYARRA